MSGTRRISILGSTGSIGRNTLDIVSRHRDTFPVTALASRFDWKGIVEQALRFDPSFVALFDEGAADKAREALRPRGIAVLSGIDGVLEAAASEKADIVVSAIVGAAGIMPTFAAVQAGKVVALANKEALVAAGRVIMAEAERAGSTIIPVDSEHSAVFQALMGQERSSVRRVLLTASGGPFFGKSPGFLARVTPEMALDHPRWKMGPKVTIDSATMMNKGLEVIEARWIFDIPADRIEVLIHPQSVVHSIVEYRDGSMLAQMGVTDMRIPIAFALSYPRRLDLGLEPLDLAKIRSLEFHTPDPEMFPCLGLAYEALGRENGAPAVMNAANEIAVEAFLNGDLPFADIPGVVRAVMDDPPPFDPDTLSGILKGDQAARVKARESVSHSLSRRS
ncbi:MAG: 1-deoxy-D-xylulose-5-phosphate reductoisomerase [bacterium]|nr:1-deoxy-D-xylulose-5-phosphate reductoisomerase [bacterium]MDT8396592.1 1-deoxy-D-xylulose-5-phosphate reductoisomerase [bacterium]